ncbi:hypothetical protein PsYK624_163200 [Phanerochaete sordida]|uniref:Uncharacterized protein n=1 Tax=Phanerochaete sordida TaxID=48140 RepID=A0A9P3GR90_9APHY|nr:hypothetical protein PsYK624_163200 [Phanerochaete sordida]
MVDPTTDKKRKRYETRHAAEESSAPEHADNQSSTASDEDARPTTRARNENSSTSLSPAASQDAQLEPSDAFEQVTVDTVDTDPVRDDDTARAVQMRLADTKIDVETFPLSVDDAVLTRLNTLNSASNPSNGEYTMSTLPIPCAKYGILAMPGPDDPSRYLHVGKTKALLHFIGEISALKLGTLEDVPDRVFVGIRPVVMRDFFTAAMLVTNMSNPPRSDFADRATIFAGKFTNKTSFSRDKANTNKAKRQNTPFTQLYNWSDASLARPVRAEASDFKRGDIVMVDAYLYRWKLKDKPGEASTTNTAASTSSPSSSALTGDDPVARFAAQQLWIRWRADYELVKLTLLHSATPENITSMSVLRRRETDDSVSHTEY